MAAFAGLATNSVFADCDVDAADLHLVLEPKVKRTSDFSGGKQADIIAEKCIGCGNGSFAFAVKKKEPVYDLIGLLL